MEGQGCRDQGDQGGQGGRREWREWLEWLECRRNSRARRSWRPRPIPATTWALAAEEEEEVPVKARRPGMVVGVALRREVLRRRMEHTGSRACRRRKLREPPPRVQCKDPEDLLRHMGHRWARLPATTPWACKARPQATIKACLRECLLEQIQE